MGLRNFYASLLYVKWTEALEQKLDLKILGWSHAPCVKLDSGSGAKVALRKFLVGVPIPIRKFHRCRSDLKKNCKNFDLRCGS